MEAPAGRQVQPSLQLPAPPPPQTPSPSFPSRGIAGLVSPTHPSVLPWCSSPRAGDTLWTGRVAGEPPESASVTAEAGKLPTLNVRPFWPFQVVESGLWEEALLEGTEGEGGLGSGPHSARKLCACSGSCLEEGRLFSP